MNKYSVRVTFRGEDIYIVEAENEEEASDKACEQCEWSVEGMDFCEPDDPVLLEGVPKGEEDDGLPF